MKRVVVVGAGLAGLTVAFRRAVQGDVVTIVEASGRTGGQLLTTTSAAGFLVEEGAEGYVARSEAVPRLAGALGVGDQIMGQAVSTSFRYHDGALSALAPGEAAKQLEFQVAKSDVGAGIHTFARGMQSLTDALVAALPPNAMLRCGAPAASITPGAREREVVLATGERIAADAIVVATSSAAAAKLLAPAFGEPAAALAPAPTLSSVTVSLAYPRSAVPHALDGTGFVVAEPFEGCRAATFTSSKFAGRAPASAASLRVFFRPEGDELARLADDEWAARAARALERVLGVRGAATARWVSRWANALPVFSSEHVARVAALEASLAGAAIAVAGSAFHGSGIDAAVRSAEAVSAAL